MKKAFLSGFLGIALAFVVASCGGNGEATDSVADTMVAPAETECMQHCQMTCPDSVCLAAKCENCTCPDSSACHQKPCCKKDGEGCAKVEGAACANAEGDCCKKADSDCCKKADSECCKKEQGK